MEKRALGSTGDRIGALCMGTWEIGGLAWGPIAAPDAADLVRAALDAGITAFDTAEQYGNGRSEVILGAALAGRRDEVFLISKTGWMMGADGAQMFPQGQLKNFHAASITHACEQGLRRLQTHYIDVYLLHDPPAHIIAQDEPIQALERLQQSGKIRWWGVSANAKDAAAAIRRGAQVVETPFNALVTEATQDLFPLALEKGAGILARSPFASGMLTLGPGDLEKLPATDFRRAAFRDRWAEGEAVRKKIGDLARQRGEKPAETAIKFVLSHEEVSTCIVGLSAPGEIAPNVAAAKPPYLEKAEMQKLAPSRSSA